MRFKRLSLFLAAVLAVLLLVPVVTNAGGDLVLDATTESIEVATSAATNVDYRCSFLDTTTTATTPVNSDGQITTATDTTVVAAPAASTQRKVSGCDFLNTSTTTSNTLTVQFDTSGTERQLYIAELRPRWSLHWSEGKGWYLTDELGRDITARPAFVSSGGRHYSFYKRATAPEAGTFWYDFGKDSGFPGRDTFGTPGLNGDALSCDTSADAVIAGTYILPDPSSGSWYLSYASFGLSSAGHIVLYDLLWYNTGINVTTTTAQSITHPGIPARDVNGSSNGDGVMVSLLATAAIGGGTVTNTTLSYTDQDGNTGNTATLASWNATSVIGTAVEFQLADGDTGIRTIESITLGTTYTSGSLSLIQYRPIGYIGSSTPALGAMISGGQQASEYPGLRIWNDTCFRLKYLAPGTTANHIYGGLALVER